MQIAPATSLAFTIAAQPGSYALLVGAGASVSAEMPSAWHVQRDLILRIAATEGLEDEATGADEAQPFDWYQQRYGKAATYDRLLAEVAPAPLQRLNLLRGFFEATDEDRTDRRKQPMAAHHAIAALVQSGHVRIIVTLNFDHLIEEAVRALGIEPIVVNTQAGIEGLQPLHEYKCLVVHLHGDYTHPEMRNTPDELGAYPDPVLRFLQRLQSDYGLLATGWSGQWDPALRESIDAAGIGRYPVYWANAHAPTGEGAELAQRKRAIICEAPADGFFPDLHSRILAIEERAERHPVDATTLVSAAKRELDSPSSRAIRTHDNLLTEIRNLHQLDEFTSLRTIGRMPESDVERRTTRVLAQMQPLCALLATLAYWGRPETDAWWINDLSKIAPHRHSNWSSGDARLRPGAILYATCGTAAAAAGRYDIAARLLTQPSPLRYLRRAVDLYGPSAFPSPADAEGSSPSRQLFDAVAPTLHEHLLLNEDVLREAWETWHYLELVHATYLERQGGDATTNSMTPHLRRQASGNLPVIHPAVVELVRTDAGWGPADNPLAKRLFDGDLDKFGTAIDETNAWLMSPGPFKRDGSAGKRYFDD